MGRGRRTGRQATPWAEASTGARVVVLLGSVNRDESLFPDGERFDLDRPGTQLPFGHGPHYCIGHYFARAQLAVAIRMLFERFPRLHLDPEHEPVYRGHEYRSPKSLRVLVD